jgi:hypothetical protein
MKQKGFLRNVDWKHFDGGNHCVVDNPQYPAEMVMKNFREAEKLYEKGFNNRYSSTAKDNFKSIEINSTREILLFRTARMKQINDCRRQNVSNQHSVGILCV